MESWKSQLLIIANMTIMPPLIPRDIYIHVTSLLSSSQNDASKQNISGTETEYSDCVRLSWVKIMLAVFGFCGDAITVYHSARHLCVLQCCSAAGWSDNHGVKMEHLANFIRPRSPLETMNTPAGLRKPQHVIIIILRYWWINPLLTILPPPRHWYRASSREPIPAP